MKLSSRFDPFKTEQDPISAYLSSLRFDIEYFTDWPQQSNKTLKDIVGTRIKLVLQQSGTSELTARNAHYTLEPGSCMFIPPYTVYSAQTHEDVHAYEIFFNVHPAIRESEFLQRMNLNEIACFPGLLRPADFDMIAACYRAVRDNCAGAYAQLQSLLIWLLVQFARTQNAAVPAHALSLREQAVVERLFDYLQAHMAEPVRVEQICEALEVSQSYLYRCSHNVMNCSTAQLITRFKMRHAKTLLKDPSLSISEVADAVGYDPFYFSNQFKKSFLVSPSEYRKSLVQK